MILGFPGCQAKGVYREASRRTSAWDYNQKTTRGRLRLRLTDPGLAATLAPISDLAIILLLTAAGLGGN